MLSRNSWDQPLDRKMLSGNSWDPHLYSKMLSGNSWDPPLYSKMLSGNSRDQPPLFNGWETVGILGAAAAVAIAMAKSGAVEAGIAGAAAGFAVAVGILLFKSLINNTRSRR